MVECEELLWGKLPKSTQRAEAASGQRDEVFLKGEESSALLSWQTGFQ